MNQDIRGGGASSVTSRAEESALGKGGLDATQIKPRLGAGTKVWAVMDGGDYDVSDWPVAVYESEELAREHVRLVGGEVSGPHQVRAVLPDLQRYKAGALND